MRKIQALGDFSFLGFRPSLHLQYIHLLLLFLQITNVITSKENTFKIEILDLFLLNSREDEEDEEDEAS